MKQLNIKFRNNNIDTEEVREAIEDNLGVEILEIEEEIIEENPIMFKCPKCAEEMKEDKELDEVYCDCGYSEHIKKSESEE